jgi:hypothetical protein
VDRLGRGGQHRSAPFTLDTPAGPLILTRVANGAGAAHRLEVRAVLTLPDQAAAAQHHAARLVNRMAQALTLDATGRGACR